MLCTCIQYGFVFHSTCYICDSRMISIGTSKVSSGNQQYNVGEKPTVIRYTYIDRHADTPDKKQKQNKNNVAHHQTCK